MTSATLYVRTDIARMTGYVPGEQPQTGKFIKLNTNENPYPASPAVGRALEQAIKKGLQRYPDPMANAFRQRAAEIFEVEPNFLLCGNGSDDILTIVTRALVGQREWLRYPYPSYILYKTLGEIQGASTDEIFFREDWCLRDEFFAGDENLRLVFLPNPNSPSGTLIPSAEIRRLAESLPCPLLVDEAYADFADTNCLPLVKECENLMVSRSLSKSYALAGVRFGFLVAQPSLIEQFIKVKDSYNCDALAISAATAAIDDQAWFTANRQKIIATRSRLDESLRNFGFRTTRSQANFVWATHESLPLCPIYEELKQRGILVRYMNYEHWGDGLRISVGTDEQIDAFLTILKTLV